MNISKCKIRWEKFKELIANYIDMYIINNKYLFFKNVEKK